MNRKTDYPPGRAPVIVSAVRTAIGKFGGTLAGFTAVELGAMVGTEAIKRAGVDGALIDEVIMSNARQAGVGPNPGRAVVPRCGLAETVTGSTINMACGSGLKAVEMASMAIAAGAADVVLVIGVEAMSQIPYLLPGARWGYRLGNGEALDALHKDGFICALTNQHMGLTAENVASRYGITRRESDEYAALSQQRAEAAITGGHFASQILPVPIAQRKGPAVPFVQDEHPRFGSTVEGIAGLKPVFKPDGIVTAASASGITDGAAAVVIAAEDTAQAHGLPAMLRIRGMASAGVDPSYMGIGPVPATRAALERTGLTIADLDLIEVNEAFAPQVLACERDLGYDRDRANVDGGAIALGHPIGMTGVRLLVALAHAMPRRGAGLGLATVCINGGMGMAAVVEQL
ncbi:MAG: acetyl-CoA C-acyltransferase [Bacillota bacterium]|nr:acetyl-CoA C-acyltransferase [Bacillota bacterium]